MIFMNNDFIEKYKNEPDVKRLLDELKEKEKEYAAKEKNAERQKKAEYRQWYKSLSDGEKFSEKLRLIKEQEKEVKAQMRKFERKQNKTEAQKARDERTHFLIQLGAELDTALHHYFPDYVTGDPDTLESEFVQFNGMNLTPLWEYMTLQIGCTKDSDHLVILSENYQQYRTNIIRA